MGCWLYKGNEIEIRDADPMGSREEAAKRIQEMTAEFPMMDPRLEKLNIGEICGLAVLYLDMKAVCEANGYDCVSSAIAIANKSRDLAQSVLGRLEDGFIVCEKCRHQEATKGLDVVYELRDALKL